jgi:hypothetical protein
MTNADAGMADAEIVRHRNLPGNTAFLFLSDRPLGLTEINLSAIPRACKFAQVVLRHAANPGIFAVFLQQMPQKTHCAPLPRMSSFRNA